MAGKKPMLPLADERPQAYCKWEGCLQKAVVCEEIEYGKGRHNLCEYHYIQAHAQKAKRCCEAKGLFTVEQKQEFMRKLRRGVRPMPMSDREAGQDDEERQVA